MVHWLSEKKVQIQLDSWVDITNCLKFFGGICVLTLTITSEILLMVQKSCTTWDVSNPVNTGINYQPQLVSRISTIIPYYQLLTNWNSRPFHSPFCFFHHLWFWFCIVESSPKQNWQQTIGVEFFNYLYSWNPDVYFWRSTPQNKAFSNQKKGHFGSRFSIYIYTYFLFNIHIQKSVIPERIHRTGIFNICHSRNQQFM